MTETVRCISPVNGELYAERSLTPDAEVDAAIAAARSARAEWARLPVFERARYCTAAVDAMLETTEAASLMSTSPNWFWREAITIITQLKLNQRCKQQANIVQAPHFQPH